MTIMSFVLFHLDPKIGVGKLTAIRICDDGPSIVCASANKVSNDVRDVRDHSLKERLASIGPRVKRGAAGLTIRNKVRAEEVRKLCQKVINIIFTTGENINVHYYIKVFFTMILDVLGHCLPLAPDMGWEDQ